MCDHLDTPRCPRPACLHPHGVCLMSVHRIDASFLKPRRAIAVAGPVEQRMAVEYAEGHENTERRPVGPLRFAFNTYRLYRRWGISRKASLRHALLAWKQH